MELNASKGRKRRTEALFKKLQKIISYSWELLREIMWHDLRIVLKMKR